MPESLGPVDRRIAAALQLNGRCSWTLLAQALGIPESTATRRGMALLDAGSVAVTGVLDHLRCGLGMSVYVRMRVRPGSALRVAESVARLPRLRFVSVLTGRYDVVGEFVAPDPGGVLDIVGEIGHLAEVTETESMVVTRKYAAYEEWDPGLLDDAAVGLLRSAGTVVDYAHRDWTEPVTPTDQELAIAAVLARNGRTGYSALAAELGISESTAARRVESLVQRGMLRFRTLVEPRLLGLDLQFMLWLSVEPDKLERVGETLAKQPSTQLISATTGPHNLMVQGVLPGYGDLHHYTTTVLGGLRGVRDADTAIQARILKRAWVDLDDDGRPVRKETA